MKRYDAYINGQLVSPKGGYSTVTNPATGEQVYEVANCGASEVNAAINAAYDAQKAWSKRPIMQRGDILRRFGQILLDHVDELALILSTEQGKTLEQSKG